MGRKCLACRKHQGDKRDERLFRRLDGSLPAGRLRRHGTPAALPPGLYSPCGRPHSRMAPTSNNGTPAMSPPSATAWAATTHRRSPGATCRTEPAASPCWCTTSRERNGLGVAHWVAYNVPATVRGFAENEIGAPSLNYTGGKSTLNLPHYVGPCPPVNTGKHLLRVHGDRDGCRAGGTACGVDDAGTHRTAGRARQGQQQHGAPVRAAMSRRAAQGESRSA